MEKYISRIHTPLRLHRAYQYVGLPVLFLSSLALITVAVITGVINVMGISLGAVIATLSLVQFIGFFHWRKWSYYAAMAMFIFLEMVFAFIALSAFLSSEWIVAITGAIALAPVAGMTLYYAMRSELFSDNYVEADPVDRVDSAFLEKHVKRIQMKASDNLRKIVLQKRRCPYCGELLPEGVDYCCYCGNHLREKREAEEKSV